MNGPAPWATGPFEGEPQDGTVLLRGFDATSRLVATLGSACGP